ncbi:MAG: hypothetical protein ACE3JN_03235 [Ectobacillus sp.]
MAFSRAFQLYFVNVVHFICIFYLAFYLEIKYERELSQKEEQKFLEELRKSGMHIEEHPDIPSFQKAVQPVYKEFAPQVGADLIEEIKQSK